MVDSPASPSHWLRAQGAHRPCSQTRRVWHRVIRTCIRRPTWAQGPTDAQSEPARPGTWTTDGHASGPQPRLSSAVQQPTSPALLGPARCVLSLGTSGLEDRPFPSATPCRVARRHAIRALVCVLLFFPANRRRPDVPEATRFRAHRGGRSATARRLRGVCALKVCSTGKAGNPDGWGRQVGCRKRTAKRG